MRFTSDGRKMFVAVGSASNVDDPDTTPDEKNRADILRFNPDGSGMRVYAYGIRNAGGGLAINPTTGELSCSVNERDGLGDDLVPDYITHVDEGGFDGWPWWYIGSHQGGESYLVLNQQNGVRLPENVLDRIGVPGILVKGKVLDADGMRALAVAGLAP